MSTVLITLLTGLNLFFFFVPSVNADDLFDIAISASTKQIKSYALVDTISKSPRIIEIDA